jgi:hypothetical protein
MQILGLGTISFSSGKDGGRDGRFAGTASRFPSEAAPGSGKFVIQSKHTSVPGASCSDSAFQTLFKGELPKVTALATAGELDYYLLFTNRSLTAGMEAKLIKALVKIKGVKAAWIVADDPIRQHLDSNPEVWTSMGFQQALTFRFVPEDINEVVRAFHAAITTGSTKLGSASNFGFVGKETKNTVNGLTKPYYEYMKRDSLPSFGRIRDFLQDERNAELRGFYHDAADELKQKIITFRSGFQSFEEVLTHVFDLIISDNADTFKKFKALQRILSQNQADVTYMEGQIERLGRVRDIARQVRTVEVERQELINQITTDVETPGSTSKRVSVEFHNLVRRVLSLDGQFYVTLNRSSNLEFKIDTKLSTKNAPVSSQSEGTSYKKLLCALFDIALLVVMADVPFYHFVYHDGILEGLDTRKRRVLLDLLREIAAKYKIQYIMSAIDSDLPRDEKDNRIEFPSKEIVLELSDQGTKGRLFRMDEF